MAQYYQVTSLEELHKLYPNLQIDNVEEIPCMIQDDQMSQYTEAQGQQVIATIEQTGMQLPCNTSSSTQCTSQQSQFVVHQPTQYVIQQMDTSESQSSVQYIQQKPQSTESQKEEIPMVQFKDQNVRSINADIGRNENSLKQCTTKQDTSQQYLSQVQPILQQPIQIHPQIQAIDMSGNILVLHDQQQQELLLNQNKTKDLDPNSLEKEEHQQQPQHIIIQRHSQPKPQQVIQKTNSAQECIQHQILQSRHIVQSVGQQQQIIHQAPQQIIQPLQYFNQVTVIDGFSQPRVTIEHHPTVSENQQQQTQSQTHQYRPKKPMHQQGLPLIQQPQVLVPQRFGMSSPPLGSNVSQRKQEVSQSEIEKTPAPVFIVQKMDSPFLIRQHQTKVQFQTPQSGDDKINENLCQSITTQCEPEFVENVKQESLQTIQTIGIQSSEHQQKMNAAGQTSMSNKCSPERNLNSSQVKVGIVEQPFEAISGEQLNKLKVCTPILSRTQVTKIKTVEQQTDSAAVGDLKEVSTPQFHKVNNPELQPGSLPGLQSQMQSPIEHGQIQLPSRGRGLRAHLPRGYQLITRPRGVQMQISPRLPNAERGGICRTTKPRCQGKITRSGLGSGGSEQRSAQFVRAGVQQVVSTSATKNETNLGPSEVVEEARMVVVLINGEKKIVKIPCSQNILLGQILQQAGISLTSTTPITIEQITDNNSDVQTASKSSQANNQPLSVAFKPTNISQVVSVPNSPGAPRSIVTTIPQRPRQSPYSSQATNLGIIKHRLHFASPRMSSPNYSGSPTVTSNENSQSQNLQSSTPPLTPAKEEPRFVTGYMAVCPFCGISSLDFNKCIRCRRKLPENVKSQSIFSVKRKKEKASGDSEKIEECKSDGEEKQSDIFGSEEKDKSPVTQGCDRRRPKSCLKKKKISDEPTEILILSSDEEEESKLKKPGLNASALSGLKKEPVYADLLTESEMTNLFKEGSLSEDATKNLPGSFTTLYCRTIRIGSYKAQPKERIFLSSKGIRIIINSLKNETSTIIIPTSDILKVLAHFGKQIPVLFIYPLPKIGGRIRDLLGMENKIGPYYDPASTQEETHKRITLLLEKITEDNKIAINKIFGQDKLEELSEKEANEILIRASPIEMQNTGVSKVIDDVRKIMVYPPPPEKGGITLNNQDYACLGEDQFLNDVIIDFYLKYLMLKVLSPVDRNRTHVFSTFFYKRLTTKPKTLRKNDPENDPKLSPAEKRHLRVKGWTKQVNLFEKDFIIVPINEHSHWFLAIICFPGLSGPVKFSDNTPVDPEEIPLKKNAKTVQIGNTTITHIIKSDGNTISLEMDSSSDRDEAEGDQDDLHPSSDDEGTEQGDEESTSVQIPLLASASQSQPTVKDLKTKLVRRRPFKEPIKQPCILIFDSLAGASRVRVVATLRDYLKIEYKKKMGQDRDFSKDTIKGAVPKVPQQNNFTDCGLYVLQYVESFFQDPLHDFKLPLKYLQDWFPEEVVSCKRQKLATLIRSLMEEQGLKVEEMGLPVLTFTNGNNAEDDQSRLEDDEIEDEEELNEEEEAILRNRVQIAESENENEYEEDMNLEDEEEMEDEEEEEDDEDDELDEFEEEELEGGEIPRRWLVRQSGSSGEIETSLKRGRPVMYTKTTALVEYDPSDSDEDSQTNSQSSIVINENKALVSGEIPEERDLCDSDASSAENRKTVPLTEFQDFESQISCTTIKRTLEGKNNETDMVISEGEGEEATEQSRETADEEETSFETSTSGDSNVLTESFINQTLDKESNKLNKVLEKEEKTIKVPDLKKLVKDEDIIISRKEDKLDSDLFRKHLGVKKLKVGNCDKGEEVEKSSSPSSPPNTNLALYKRPYQTLKSVRIQKKTDRNLEPCSKKQKVDER